MRHTVAAFALALTLAAGGAVSVVAQEVGSGNAHRSVHVDRDIDYVPTAEYADRKDRLDVYAPEGIANAPVIISIHGGGLTGGNKDRENLIGTRFAAAGILTVVINYRLSPTVTHPSHIEDVATAVAWVKHNIGKYGGDQKRIVVIGHSAGAYLAALLATDPRYLAAHGMSTTDIMGVVPVSGFFYLDRTGVARDRSKSIWGTKVADWNAASPGTYVRAALPPTLLLYADGDDEWRRLQQTEFANAVRATGDTSISTRMIRGRTHNSIWTGIGNGDETWEAIMTFTRSLPGFLTH